MDLVSRKSRPAGPGAPIVWAISALALCCLACGQASGDAGGPGPGGGGQAPPPLPVQVAAAERTAAPLEIQAVGSLRSPQTTTIAADVAGILVYLDAPEGREVPAGHLLARLDPAEAQASLQVAEARAENARIAHERAEQLVKDGVTPQQTLDDAIAMQRTAAGLLAEARTALGKTEVRAPFAGQLGIQHPRLGTRVAAGEAIVQLTQLDPLELTFTVPEESASQVRVGQGIAGRVGRCGQRFEGTVQAVDPVVDWQSRTLQVLARVRNPDRALRPGMSARLGLKVGERKNALSVPQEALVRQGTQYIVWKLDAQNVAQPAPVQVGSFFLDSAEIVGGLQEGETVVVAGHQKLRPGAPVQPMPWEPTENPLLELGAGGEAEECE